MLFLLKEFFKQKKHCLKASVITTGLNQSLYEYVKLSMSVTVEIKLFLRSFQFELALSWHPFHDKEHIFYLICQQENYWGMTHMLHHRLLN